VSPTRAQSEPSHPTSPDGPIAIVGIGCRYADVRGPAEFWDLVREGRNTVREVPQHRVELGYDIDHFYDPRPRIPGKISSRKGGFLEHPELFDPAAFGIAPRDALTMEPQQRLLIEVTWDALEDAGIVPETIMGERVAVILGYMAEDYSRERTGVLGEAAVFRGHDVFTVGGMSHAVLSGRIAYLLGVTGPSLTLDTACSSSLIATHLACQSIRRGESKMAIAGGANIFLSPEGNIALSRSGMLSMSGACKAFDATADGFVRAEGAGVVVLRPLADALEEGNPIYAVIRGSGISTDGRDGGHMMAPGRHGQAQAMRDAYAQAGVSPSEVQYVETHGTGTMIGDPVEIAALAEVMGPGRSPDRPLRVASVKGNLGHTESASGVAGLIKAALSIRHRTLPAQLHFETPSPAIPWDEIPVRVQSETTGWPESGPALVGVNSFGISGTNAHVVLESPPEAAAISASLGSSRPAGSKSTLVPLSAHDPKALDEMLRNLRDRLSGVESSGKSELSRLSEAASHDLDAPRLEDLAHTLGLRRTHRSLRTCVVATSTDELRRELDAHLEGQTSAAVRSGVASAERSPRVVMIFPGQGAQWLGMGRGLLDANDAFSSAIDRIDAAYRRHVDWSLREVLEGTSVSDWTSRLDIVQPVLVAMEIALAEAYFAAGVRPDRVIGQSMGEIAAAHVAGALDLEDVARIACLRGRIVARASGEGAMAIVSLARADVEAALSADGDRVDERADRRAHDGVHGRVEVAGSNSPTTTIISGDRDAVLALVDDFESRGVFARPLDVDFASHCFHMDPFLDDFREALSGFEPKTTSISFDSTVDEGEKTGLDLDTEYWVRNLREPVAFDRGLERSLDAGGEIFIEVSPHATLARATTEIAQQHGSEVSHVATLQREQNEARSLSTALAELFVQGVPIDFEALQPEGRVVPTPLYAYQRKRFWFSERNRLQQFRPVHPLLGVRSDSSLDPRLHTWDFVLDVDSAGFMADFSIDGEAEAPAGLHPELALAAAAAVWPGEPVAIRDVEVLHPLRLGDAGRVVVQAVLRVDAERSGEFRVSSRVDTASAWTLHAVCRVRPRAENARSDRSVSLDRSTTESIPSDEALAALERCAVRIGPRCRTLRELESEGVDAPRSLVGRLMLPRTVESEWYAYHAHPALLEGAFQLIGSLLEPAAGVRVIDLAHVSLDAGLGSDTWCRATLRDAGAQPRHGRRIAIADLEFFDRDALCVGRIDGARVECLPERASATAGDGRGQYGIQWLPLDQAALEQTGEREVERWILVSDVAEEASLLGAELQKHGAECLFCEKVEDLAALVTRISAESRSPWGLLLLAWSEAAFEPSAERPSHRDFRIGSWASAIREHGTQAAQVWLATRGLHAIDPEDRAAVSTGRLIAREIDAFATSAEMLQCRLFDASRDLDHADRVGLAALMGQGWDDRQFAARGPRIHVPRVRPLEADVFGDGAGSGFTESAALARNFRAVHTADEGLGCVALEEFAEPTGMAGGLAVDVRNASLSQLDVLAGEGLSKHAHREESAAIGRDFSGVVREVFDAESDLRPGDEVVGWAPGAIARRLVVPRAFVTRKPPNLTFEEAATLPLPFLVARYTLDVVARLREGDRILIDSAGGGVGMAMVQVARSIGAEVSATGRSPERVRLLRKHGVRLIAGDSASAVATSAADEPEFDVIVAARSGYAMHALVARLAAGGRYVDLCPRERFERPELGVLRLEGNRSVSSVDIEEIVRAEPELTSEILDGIGSDAANVRIEPIPATCFPLEDTSRALRYMAQNRHAGRVVVDLADASDARVRSVQESATTLAGRGAYLVENRDSDAAADISQWLREAGADEVIEAGAGDASARLAALDTRGVALAGWFVTTSDLARDRAALDSFFDADRPGLRALISTRARISGEPGCDRAWEIRTTVDRMLLEGTRDDAPTLHVSIGAEADAKVLIDVLGDVMFERTSMRQVVLLDDDELAERLEVAPTPLLAGLGEGRARRRQTQLMRSELLSRSPSERRAMMQRFVGDSLAAVLGLSEDGRTSLDMDGRLDGLGLDSLMTMEFFVGMGRDLQLEISADWFDAGPSLSAIAEVLLERFEEHATRAGGDS